MKFDELPDNARAAIPTRDEVDATHDKAVEFAKIMVPPEGIDYILPQVMLETADITGKIETTVASLMPDVNVNGAMAQMARRMVADRLCPRSVTLIQEMWGRAPHKPGETVYPDLADDPLAYESIVVVTQCCIVNQVRDVVSYSVYSSIRLDRRGDTIFLSETIPIVRSENFRSRQMDVFFSTALSAGQQISQHRKASAEPGKN